MCFEAVEHRLFGIQGFRLEDCQHHVEVAILFEELFDMELRAFSKPLDVCEFAAKFTLCTVETDELRSAADSRLLIQRHNSVVKKTGAAEGDLLPLDVHAAKEVLKLRKGFREHNCTICPKYGYELFCRCLLNVRRAWSSDEEFRGTHAFGGLFQLDRSDMFDFACFFVVAEEYFVPFLVGLYDGCHLFLHQLVNGVGESCGFQTFEEVGELFVDDEKQTAKTMECGLNYSFACSVEHVRYDVCFFEC